MSLFPMPQAVDAMRQPAISIVIPTFNGRALLAQCLPTALAAIAAAGQQERVEIIVVDDGSSDDTEAFLASSFPAVRLIQSPTNQGFVHAANRGIAAARGEWIAFLNNDVLVDERWMLAVMPHFQTARVGAIATRIMMHHVPDAVDSAGDEYTVIGIPFNYANTRPHFTAGVMDQRICFSGCGASVFYRKAALLAVGGGFYERLGSYYEDVELGFRLNLAGWDTRYEPASLVLHLGSASYGKASWRKKFNTSRNAEIVFYSCMPARLLLRYILPHYAAGMLHLCLHLARGTAWAYCCGKLAFLFGCIPSTYARRRVVQQLRRASTADLRDKMVTRWFGTLVGAKIGTYQPTLPAASNRVVEHP